MVAGEVGRALTVMSQNLIKKKKEEQDLGMQEEKQRWIFGREIPLSNAGRGEERAWGHNASLAAPPVLVVESNLPRECLTCNAIFHTPVY